MARVVFPGRPDAGPVRLAAAADADEVQVLLLMGFPAGVLEQHECGRHQIVTMAANDAGWYHDQDI
jgi:hypothetical protein